MQSKLDTNLLGYLFQDATNLLLPLLDVRAKLHAFNATRQHIDGSANRLTSRLDTMIEAACDEIVERIDTKYE